MNRGTHDEERTWPKLRSCTIAATGIQRQAEAVHRGAAGVKRVEATLLTSEEATQRLDDLNAADAIIFGCPTYMGSMSAKM
jgi:NAD(P)H-dependent FMN reductase